MKARSAAFRGARVRVSPRMGSEESGAPEPAASEPALSVAVEEREDGMVDGGRGTTVSVCTCKLDFQDITEPCRRI